LCKSWEFAVGGKLRLKLRFCDLLFVKRT